MKINSRQSFLSPDPLLSFEKLTRSGQTAPLADKAFASRRHISLTDRMNLPNLLIHHEIRSRNLMLSKIRLKQKKGVKLIKKKNLEVLDRETMMYLPPKHGEPHSTRDEYSEHKEEEPSHHKSHSSGIPEGYYRCSHGCLCKKGMVHQPSYTAHNNVQGGHMEGGNMQGGHMQGGHMQGGHMQGGGMYGGQQMGQQQNGMYPNAGGMSPVGNMMNGGMNPMQPAPVPKANFPLINTIGNLGNSIIGGMGQAMDMSMGMQGQMNNMMQREIYLFLFSNFHVNLMKGILVLKVIKLHRPVNFAGLIQN